METVVSPSIKVCLKVAPNITRRRLPDARDGEFHKSLLLMLPRKLEAPADNHLDDQVIRGAG
jgi:hypothetical protein